MENRTLFSYEYKVAIQLNIAASLSNVPGAQSKVRAYTMLVPIGENVTLFSDFSLEIFYPFH